MAYTFQVLVPRQSLPEMAQLAAILRKAKLPLRLSHPWDWDKDSGWLPMHWRKSESGCEVELDKLSKQESMAAKKAGYPNLDSVLTIATRGWESLQCGAAFAACLAVNGSGCITETDGEYIAPEAALKWAKTAIKEADKQQQIEIDRNKTSDQLRLAGNIEDELASRLAALSGAKVKHIRFMMDRLGIHLETGQMIHGSAWRIIAPDGSCFAQDRYASLRTKQLRLMAATSEPLTAEQEKNLALLDKDAKKAGALDGKDAALAVKMVQGWPENLHIASVTWEPPNQIKVSLDTGVSCLFTGGIMGEISCSFPPIRFAINDEEAKLV